MKRTDLLNDMRACKHIYVEVSIPNSFSGSIVAVTTDFVQISNLVNSGAGDINVNEIQSINSLKLTSDNGKINIANVLNVQSLSASSSSGGIKLISVTGTSLTANFKLLL